MLLSIIFSWCIIARAHAAQSCWRDTPCDGPLEPSFSGPWEDNNYSPASRRVSPSNFFSLSGDQQTTEYVSQTEVTVRRNETGMVFDFGLEVGGIISFNYTIAGSSSPVRLGLAFTEAKNYVGRMGDSSRGGSGGSPGDGPYWANTTVSKEGGQGQFILPDEKMRGGFRYLTVFVDDATPEGVDVTIRDIELEISFQPTWSNLRAYGGYFHSDDELLNKIWYSGAYTVQTNSVPGNTATGDQPRNEKGWLTNGVITSGKTVLLDGAKRDRLVWIGDMGTAVPSAFVSTGDLESTKYALLSIYDNQKSNGLFPKAGPPYLNYDSHTYHLWVLVGTYNYLLYSGDVELVTAWWPKFEAAIRYSLGRIGSNGVLNLTEEADWGRITYGKERGSASMLFYRSLTVASTMLEWLHDVSAEITKEEYLEHASTLRDSILESLWDSEVGAFRDSPDNKTLYPQDANSMALAYSIFSASDEEAGQISDYLVSRWTDRGPHSPELPNNISPFMSSIELEGHFHASRPDRSLTLMRTLWGWYLNHENGTQSTVPEGFLLDGGWGYRYNKGYTNGPAYMSHAHCWSSGPTSTLSEYMLGLKVLEPAGKKWQLKPASFKLLDSWQGGITTKLGRFSASITVKGGKAYVKWDTPKNTMGLLSFPSRDPVWVNGGKGRKVMSVK